MPFGYRAVYTQLDFARGFARRIITSVNVKVFLSLENSAYFFSEWKVHHLLFCNPKKVHEKFHDDR